MSFVLSRSRLATAGTTVAVIAGTVGLTGVVTVATPVVAHAAIPAPPAGFTTTWSDDFNGASGSGADCSFTYDTGPGSSFGTGEIETMTNSTANVYQDGAGHLVLKALHTGTDPNSGWTSGRIETRGDVRRSRRRRRADGVGDPAAQPDHRQRRRLLAGVLDARLDPALGRRLAGLR